MGAVDSKQSENKMEVVSDDFDRKKYVEETIFISINYGDISSNICRS